LIDLEAHGLLPQTPPRDPGGPGTIARVLDGALAADPDRRALVGRHGRYTVAELDTVVRQAAQALRALGVGEGDRVAASLPNDVDIVIAFLAAMRLGAIWVGINRALAGPEKAYMLRDSQTSVFLGDAEMAAQVEAERASLPDLRDVVLVDPASAETGWRALVDAGGDDAIDDVEVDRLSPAAIAYTSGTTGFPKGAVHTHHNLLLPGTAQRLLYPRRNAPVLGVPLPLTLINLIVLGPLVAYQNDSTVVAMDRIDAVGMAEWISQERVTMFSAVPAMVHDLLTNPAVSDDMLTTLDGIGVGGADMPEAFRELYQKRFGRRVGTGYGLTEAPTAVTLEDPEEPPVPGSCGRALPQVSITIRSEDGAALPPGETGEVCIGPAEDGPLAGVYRPMLGYWNRPDETAVALRGGVLHTGDIGVLDEAGNLFIKDRKNDLILRGGANVYPAEVERVLHDDPRVVACAVIGVPDDRLGERVAAFVQLRGGEAPCAEELIAHCRRELAAYKAPESVTFVAGFERTPMGKIKRSALRTR
jgi:acyl-CoA synthetase (AMP-forming)/AMP-acid ligase II